ncbi:hypothetical protein FNV43_RR10124 [Rhamnella rubrinervis]|uniref:Uncharacterized protein n=1 Tax=Rhamnella rubrinervis TaxID=2594499 RepID=A0A8K0HBN6_9ROSA|nr:hypothetical protein FNV43_RR10124 [Rhamnella rubrinervis]
MKKYISSAAFLLLFLVFISYYCLSIEAQTWKPSGKIRGKKPPPGQCNKNSFCCKQGEVYTNNISPKASGCRKARLTLNNFEKGGDGGGPSECDGKFHSDNTRVVALSTRWFNNKKRCFHNIIIHGNGRSVKAMVVDECDSTKGCDNDIVDASRAVWKALKVPERKGLLDIYWTDA